MNNISSSFEYILFDLDGTISQSGPGITRCAQYALHKMGIEEPDLEKLEVFVGPPLNITFQQQYGFDPERSVEAVRLFQERYEQIGVFENEIYPGVDDMLRSLQAAGKHLAIASSKPRHLIPIVLSKFGIEDYFEVIAAPGFEQELTNKMGSDNKQFMVRLALEQLGIADPDPAALHARCAMVGDRFYDIEGALANGVTAIGVTYGYGTREELEQAGAEILADSAQELTRILMDADANHIKD